VIITNTKNCGVGDSRALFGADSQRTMAAAPVRLRMAQGAVGVLMEVFGVADATLGRTGGHLG
jgi:hypothetical protein